jgi:hypothetical protein
VPITHNEYSHVIVSHLWHVFHHGLVCVSGLLVRYRSVVAQGVDVKVPESKMKRLLLRR